MVVIASFAILAVVTACGDNSGSSDNAGVLIEPIEATATASLPPTIPGAGATQSPGSTPPPTSTPGTGSTNGSSAALTGFTWPLAGACLPKGDQLMPNAPRPYRNGIHEGIDFYDSDNCTAIRKDTPVLAAKGGRVIRADLDYRDPTPAEVQTYLADPNSERSFDQFRGRQVWIDHGFDASGMRIVTRYCHLNGIAQGITVGSNVTKGQVVAYVGESGTPESVTNPGREYHLHFEVRIGDSFLGRGLPPSQVRSLYATAFAP